MLKTLTIENYVLIQSLEINFGRGFSIITGETGAGKSILLGALSLILGQRVESNILKDKSKKCIVEGIFDISNYHFESFFEDNELDYSDITIIRREILPEGKSRAFINDTPVNLALIKSIGSKLIDIHSQHETLLLSDNLFQLKVVDTVAGHQELLEKYTSKFQDHRKLTGKLAELLAHSVKAKADLDYYQFQFDQLNEARLYDENEQKSLESELETLTHCEEIKLALDRTVKTLNGEDDPVISKLRNIMLSLSQVGSFITNAETLAQRLESVNIELKDIASEAGILNESVEYSSERIDQINTRLNQIYQLEQKHRAENPGELMRIRDELEKQIKHIANYDIEITELNAGVVKMKEELHKLAVRISENRKKVVPGIEKRIKELLSQMGIPAIQFKILSEQVNELNIRGIDNVRFLLSTNRNVEMQEISKVASGGEFSRIMLSIKSLLSSAQDMPTIIFDEIDTGVSGEIADKVGNILKDMSAGIQVINITHLPQIAVKGNDHFLVYKSEDAVSTNTNIKLLSEEEKLVEIAKMLSGNELTEAAFLNARDLLKN
ncbi:MAG: DNA repair protein RecN [Bacteroidia bacterium]|nr:DNA repair protein RecN [Bacteroidia bacterium]